MITNNDIKNLRLAHSLTLQQMSRAIFVEDSTLSNYEAGRRTPSLDMLEKIANVFGCTVDFTLIQKKGTAKNKDFYKEKSYDEIMNLSVEDLTDYIFITQNDEMISKICDISINIIKSLELSTLKDLLKNTLSNSRRDVVYFMLNNLYSGVELDISLLIEETYEYLKLEENIPREIADKVCYIDFDLYGDVWRDELLSDNSRLLDINKEDLGVDHEFIFNSEVNPLIYNAQSIDVLEYLRENPVVQIKY